MRLIDAETYEQTLIANDWDKEIDGFSTEGVFELLGDAPTVQAIPIPDNATNGDMIKVVFKPYRVVEFSAQVQVYFSEQEWQMFGIGWWNAPYKGVNDESNN